jgi:hypothetical protein
MFFNFLNKNQRLWKKIEKFEIDESDSKFKFSDRLAKENSWTKGFSLDAILEYKKFIFLCVISDKPQTPSEQVDKVWHLHLLYTKSYWNDFCKNTLKYSVEHNPTEGGDNERGKFIEQYRKTLENYKVIFGTVPPSKFWASVEQRFGINEFSNQTDSIKSKVDIIRSQVLGTIKEYEKFISNANSISAFKNNPIIKNYIELVKSNIENVERITSLPDFGSVNDDIIEMSESLSILESTVAQINTKVMTNIKQVEGELDSKKSNAREDARRKIRLSRIARKSAKLYYTDQMHDVVTGLISDSDCGSDCGCD